MDRMSSLDAGFLQIEGPTQPMHVGSLLLLEGPAPGYVEMRDTIAARLPGVRRYRQRARQTPFSLTRPTWVDDPHFSIEYHVRHTAVPSPGTDEQLRTLFGRVMSQRLDLERPLWELWLVDGLSDGRWALISKVHHALVDGISGNDLLEMLLDRDPDAVHPPAEPWTPEPEPSSLALVASAGASLAHVPVELGQALARALRDPTGSARSGAVRAYGLLQAGRRVASPTSILNGPLSPHRRWGWARAALADAKQVKNAAGCTVNDVVLAAIAGAFHAYLTHRGEVVTGDVVRSLVPVSIHTPDHAGRLGNHVTAMFADLPVGVDDPLERLAAVAAQMTELKGSGMAVGVEAMVDAADFVPPTLMALGARVAVSTGQRVVNAVTTNIPGPQYPLHCLGRRMTAMYPFIPIGEGVRVSIGIVSYDGQLTFGVTGDYDAFPDLDLLCEGIERSLAQLVEAVAETTPVD